MKRIWALLLLLSVVPFIGCKKKGYDYRLEYKVLRQNTQPAAGFNVDVWVKGKSEPRTFVTDSAGMIKLNDLPTPDIQHQLVTALHYCNGKNEDKRQIAYPFITSDSERLKDTQYIPNNATPAVEK